ncbi:MAG: hypothetical protein P8177_00465 [Gemmatimonadota bacterium]
MKRFLLWGLVAFAVVLSGGFVAVSLQIGADVEAISRQAVARYGGDPVDALLVTVDCTDCSLRDRNRAVWALGQLGDGRALAGLRRHHTGQPCDHGRHVCQRELEKAIAMVEGSFNATALVWR